MKTRKIKLTLIFTILMSLIIGLITFLSMNLTSSTNINFNNQNKEINYSLNKKNPHALTITTSTLSQPSPKQLKHDFVISKGVERIINIRSVLEIKRSDGGDWVFFASQQRGWEPTLPTEATYTINSDDAQLNNKFRATLEIDYEQDEIRKTTSKPSAELTFQPIPKIEEGAVEIYFTDSLKFRILAKLSAPIDNNTTLSYQVATRDIGSTEEPTWGTPVAFEAGKVDAIYSATEVNKEYKFKISGKYNLNGTDIDLGGSGTVETNWEKIEQFSPIQYKVDISKDTQNQEKFVITIEFTKSLVGDDKFKDFEISLMKVNTPDPDTEVQKVSNPTVDASDDKKYVFKTEHNGIHNSKYKGLVSFKYENVTYLNSSIEIESIKNPNTDKADLKHIDANAPTNSLQLVYKLSHTMHMTEFKLHLHKADGTLNSPPNVNDDTKWTPARDEEIINPLPGEVEKTHAPYTDLDWNKWYMVKMTSVFGSSSIVHKSNPAFVFKKPPTSKPLIDTKNGDANKGKFSFEVKLENIIETDPYSTIQEVNYKLLVSDNAGGTNPADSNISANSTSWETNFLATLESTDDKPILGDKYYSVEATITANLGDSNNLKTITENSTWIQIKNITQPEVETSFEMEKVDSKISFKTKLNNVATNDPNDFIKNVTYKLLVSDKENGDDPTYTNISITSDKREDDFSATLTSNDQHTIAENKFYSIQAVVNYDVGDSNIKEIIKYSDWIKTPVTPKPVPPANTTNNKLGLIIGLSVGIPLAVILISIGIGLGIHNASSRGIHKISDFWREIE